MGLTSLRGGQKRPHSNFFGVAVLEKFKMCTPTFQPSASCLLLFAFSFLLSTFCFFSSAVRNGPGRIPFTRAKRAHLKPHPGRPIDSPGPGLPGAAGRQTAALGYAGAIPIFFVFFSGAADESLNSPGRVAAPLKKSKRRWLAPLNLEPVPKSDFL
jgi:hypothetical protein